MWLAQRARRYQEACFVVKPQTDGPDSPRGAWMSERKSLSLRADVVGPGSHEHQLAGNQAEIAVRPELERYLRYQAHHDRAYARASAELLKRRNERRKAAIGFESQKLKAAEETRKQERHQLAVSLAKVRLEHEVLKNRKLKTTSPSDKLPQEPQPAALAA